VYPHPSPSPTPRPSPSPRPSRSPSPRHRPARAPVLLGACCWGPAGASGQDVHFCKKKSQLCPLFKYPACPLLQKGGMSTFAIWTPDHVHFCNFPNYIHDNVDVKQFNGIFSPFNVLVKLYEYMTKPLNGKPRGSSFIATDFILKILFTLRCIWHES